jgi:hypothetical protein
LYIFGGFPSNPIISLYLNLTLKKEERKSESDKTEKTCHHFYWLNRPCRRRDDRVNGLQQRQRHRIKLRINNGRPNPFARMLVPKLVQNGFYFFFGIRARFWASYLFLIFRSIRPSRTGRSAQKEELKPFLTILGTSMRAKFRFESHAYECLILL